MSEKQIEQKLITAVKKAGGICPKFVAPGMAGMPDRIVILKEGHIGFVEVKAPGQKPRKLQIRRHLMLRALGCQVFVLDDTEQIPHILTAIKEGGDAE